MAEQPDLMKELPALLAPRAPQRLLALGIPARELVTSYADQPSSELVCLTTAGAAGELTGPPYDLALVSDLEQVSAADGGILLGRLRDLYARRILAVLDSDASTGLGHRDLIGYGFSGLGRYCLAGKNVQLYEFDIGSYKTTPDWLNNKHWANPRLFDKHRW